MMWNRKRTVIAGVALIMGVNIFALAGVFFNRSGTAESTLKLSERELTLPGWRDNKEDSGLSLKISWRVLPPEPIAKTAPDKNADDYTLYPSYSGESDWLNESKMIALGFDPSSANSRLDERSSATNQKTRDVMLVLQLNGSAYETALKRAIKYNSGSKENVKMMINERDKNSRLFVIDAGLNATALRAAYPDRSQYAIVRGQIRPFWNADNKKKLAGVVSTLNVDTLHVPLKLRHTFDGASLILDEAPAAKLVRYEADVAFGQRLEPWITAATRK